MLLSFSPRYEADMKMMKADNIFDFARVEVCAILSF